MACSGAERLRVVVADDPSEYDPSFNVMEGRIDVVFVIDIVVAAVLVCDCVCCDCSGSVVCCDCLASAAASAAWSLGGMTPSSIGLCVVGGGITRKSQCMVVRCGVGGHTGSSPSGYGLGWMPFLGKYFFFEFLNHFFQFKHFFQSNSAVFFLNWGELWK